MKKLVRLYAVALTAILALSTVRSSANLVSNGGFETGDFTGWTQFGNTGFSAVAGAFFGVSPHSGSFHAHFGPAFSLGGVSQTLAVTPGATYQIDFWLDNLGGTPSEFKLTWDGNTLDDLVNPSAFAYTHFSYTAVASGSSALLEFAFRNDPSFFFLDDVSVEPVSTPDGGSTVALMGLALAGLAAFRRKLAV